MDTKKRLPFPRARAGQGNPAAPGSSTHFGACVPIFSCSQCRIVRANVSADCQMTISLKRIRERVAYQVFNLRLTFACHTHQVFSHRAESERINTIIARNPVMPLQVRNKESVRFFGTLLITSNECPHSSTSSCINFSTRGITHAHTAVDEVRQSGVSQISWARRAAKIQRGERFRPISCSRLRA